jgi:hypothetical protein
MAAGRNKPVKADRGVNRRGREKRRGRTEARAWMPARMWTRSADVVMRAQKTHGRRCHREMGAGSQASNSEEDVQGAEV